MHISGKYDFRPQVEALLGERLPDELWEELVEEGWADVIVDEETAVRDCADEARARLEELRRSTSFELPATGRLEALARIAAAEAGADPLVRLFRSQVLGGELLAQEAVERWLSEQEQRSPSYVEALQQGLLPVTVRVRIADGGGRPKVLAAQAHPEEGALALLKKAALRLSARMRWPEDEAAGFILTGAAPAYSAGEVRTLPNLRFPALSRVVLVLDPRTPEQEVRELYVRARERLLQAFGMGRGSSRFTAKHMELAAFFSERGREARDWEALLRLWNGAYPSWAYRSPSAVQDFARDVRQAWERVTGRRWPGYWEALDGRLIRGKPGKGGRHGGQKARKR